MKIINAEYRILTPITGDELKFIEYISRTCYNSFSRMSEYSSEIFVKGLIDRGHEAMLEHSSLSVKFICDRGVSHELVRHRLASFAQESTRYIKYGELTFIKPCYLQEDTPEYNNWKAAMEEAEKHYYSLMGYGVIPQEARAVLPNSLKTTLIMTANYREWRHFFKLRAARATGAAHPQMEELTIPLLQELRGMIPVIFDDIVTIGDVNE